MRHNHSILVRLPGSAAAFFIGLALLLAVSPLAQAQNTIYAMTQSGVFGTLNVSTGAFTPISSPGFEPAGLTGLGANLFIANYPGNTLYEVNLTNGALITIGNGAVDYYDFGSTTQGLYGIGTDQNLYSVNSTNGAATLIGATGLPAGGFQAISSAGTSLYTTVPDSQGINTLLYSVNTTTGAATEIGNTGVGADISSIGFAFGQLYAAETGGNLYTLNLSTGVATLVTTTGQDFWGLALPPMTYTVIHNFTGGLDGANPWAGLTPDQSGNLYGNTEGGGSGSCIFYSQSGCGTIFKLSRRNGNWTFGPLYSFLGGTDGEFPVRPLVFGPNGTVYSTTSGGGEGTCTPQGQANGCGTVFNSAPSPTPPRTPLPKWNETTLYRFSGGSDGGIPVSPVVFDHAGNMYGTAAVDGANGFGTVFKLTPSGNSWVQSTIYNFAGGSDGAEPLDGLVLDAAGNLYGTTTAGGGSASCTNGCGTVFELSPNGSGWTERVLYRFQGPTDGENPNAGVAMDAAGNLYGNTWQGGPGGGGTVYKLSPSGGNWTFTLLYSVPGSGFTVGRIVRDSSGNLYNLLQNGGASNVGQLFKLTPSGGNWLYTDLYDFTGGTDGAVPLDSVVVDSSGNIYGTAWGGGTHPCGAGRGCGVVFAITQ